MPGAQLNVAANLKHASPPGDSRLNLSTAVAAARSISEDGTPCRHPTLNDANSGSHSTRMRGSARAAATDTQGPILSSVVVPAGETACRSSHSCFAEATSESSSVVSRYLPQVPSMTWQQWRRSTGGGAHALFERIRGDAHSLHFIPKTLQVAACGGVEAYGLSELVLPPCTVAEAHTSCDCADPEQRAARHSFLAMATTCITHIAASTGVSTSSGSNDLRSHDCRPFRHEASHAVATQIYPVCHFVLSVTFLRQGSAGGWFSQLLVYFCVSRSW